MSDNEGNLHKLCRLCGSDGGIRINIFEPGPGYIRKIEALVPNVVILRYDCFPKSLCHRCVAKLKEYHDFRENCVKTQERFRKLVPWLSIPDSTSPKISNLSAVASPIVLYMGGSPAHPFGDPEPKVDVVEVLTVSDDDDDDDDDILKKASPVTADMRAPHSAKRRRSDNTLLKDSVHPHVSQETDQHHSSGSIPSAQRLFHSNTPSPESSSSNYVPKPAVKQGGGLPPNALASNSQVQRRSLPPLVTNHSENPKIHKALHTTSRPPLPIPTTHHAHEKAVPVPPQPQVQTYLKGPSPALPVSNNSANNLSTSQQKAQHFEQTKKFQNPGPQTSVPTQTVPSVRPTPAFYKSVRITDEKKAETDKSPIKLKISAVHSVVDASGQWTNENGYSQGSNAIAAQTSNGNSTKSKKNPLRRPKPKSKQKPQTNSAQAQEQEYLSEELKEQGQPSQLSNQLRTEHHLPHCSQQQSQQKQTDDKNMHHPKIQSIQISKTSSVFTCSECNRIYINEESIVGHECSGSWLPNATLSVLNIRSSAVNDSANGTDSSGQNVCKDQTNLSENSSGLNSNIPCIPIVDDDSPSSSVNELLTCKKCFKVFHSCTRLIKHQISCLGVA